MSITVVTMDGWTQLIGDIYKLSAVVELRRPFIIRMSNEPGTMRLFDMDKGNLIKGSLWIIPSWTADPSENLAEAYRQACNGTLPSDIDEARIRVNQ